MCLILLLAYCQHPAYRLVLAANRDEFRDRPTAPADFWDDAPELLAGRDLRAGGTWLGVTRSGRLAAVTNYRDPNDFSPRARSRGDLTREFLLSDYPPHAYLLGVAERAAEYNGFNLLVADRTQLGYFGNRGDGAATLPPGIYGLSNHLLDTPWPKVRAGRERLARALAGPQASLAEALFAVLADDRPFGDQELPDTGVGLERERQLSALRIAGREYGTRSSTVVLESYAAEIDFRERTLSPDGAVTGERSFKFTVDD